jgi:parallel beta-helix repeat protein
MFRKTIFSVFFVLVLLCSVGLIAAAPAPVAAATRAVPGTYATIQAAINAATNGDIITVAAGTYNENVIVNKSVSLRGASSATVTVNSTSPGATVFNVTVNSVNISGFTVSCLGNVEAQAGIKLGDNATLCNISNNVLTVCMSGIRLGSHSNHNTFNNNTLTNNCQGFEVISSDYNTFTNNNASLNLKYGFKLESGDHNTFTNNTANSNGISWDGKWVGIGFYTTTAGEPGVTNSTFTNNIANSNNDYGMRIHGGIGNTLTGNTLDGNLVGGLRLNYNGSIDVTTNLLVKNNYITDNGIGVDIVGTLVNVKINDNDISGNDDIACGIHHDGTGILDATRNWWGDCAGPDIFTNPYYIWTDGDEIGGSNAGDVTYVPWLIHKTLNPGWNIFSAPIALSTTTDTVGEALNYWTSDSAKATIVWTYNGRSWVRGSAATALTPMVPVFLWINGSATATIDVLMSTSPSTPPSITLYQGWNLAGPGQLVPRPVRNALTSAYYGSSYYYYGGGANSIGYSQVISPTPNSRAWTYFRFVSYGYEDEQDNPYCLWMIPTEGYWIYMVNPGSLAGWTFTPIVSYGYDIP